MRPERRVRTLAHHLRRLFQEVPLETFTTRDLPGDEGARARSARERFHKTTVTRAFRHSGGHAEPFGRVTSYIGCLVTSVVWVPVDTRMVTLEGVKSGKDAGQVAVAEVQVALLVDPSGAVTTTVTGV